MKSLFEHNGGTYCKQGDYLVPNLILPKSKENDIGIYGQLHLKFLQEHRRLTYINLLTSGELNEYLSEIDKQARECFCRIVKQLKITWGITEQLRADSPMVKDEHPR
jgi:predicted phosphodiesterase